mmetsp:Transcript_14609/g.34655  ORF Transcript_14609/g.34655 Transcript_14609/m.34655 type:complete len:408 (+) Transcript_14609:3693-4916(+)
MPDAVEELRKVLLHVELVRVKGVQDAEEAIPHAPAVHATKNSMGSPRVNPLCQLANQEPRPHTPGTRKNGERPVAGNRFGYQDHPPPPPELRHHPQVHHLSPEHSQGLPKSHGQEAPVPSRPAIRARRLGSHGLARLEERLRRKSWCPRRLRQRRELTEQGRHTARGLGPAPQTHPASLRLLDHTNRVHSRTTMHSLGRQSRTIQLHLQGLPAPNPRKHPALRLRHALPPHLQGHLLAVALDAVKVISHKVGPVLHLKVRHRAQPGTIAEEVLQQLGRLVTKPLEARFPSQLPKAPLETPEAHHHQRVLGPTRLAARVQASTRAPQRRATTTTHRRWIPKQILRTVREQGPGRVHVARRHRRIKGSRLPPPHPGLLGDGVASQSAESRAPKASRRAQVHVVSHLSMI